MCRCEVFAPSLWILPFCKHLSDSNMYAFPRTYLGLPAERLDPVYRKLHLRHITDPPAFTPRKPELCLREVHLFGDNFRYTLHIDPVL